MKLPTSPSKRGHGLVPCPITTRFFPYIFCVCGLEKIMKPSPCHYFWERGTTQSMWIYWWQCELWWQIIALWIQVTQKKLIQCNSTQRTICTLPEISFSFYPNIQKINQLCHMLTPCWEYPRQKRETGEQMKRWTCTLVSSKRFTSFTSYEPIERILRNSDLTWNTCQQLPPTTTTIRIKNNICVLIYIYMSTYMYLMYIYIYKERYTDTLSEE